MDFGVIFANTGPYATASGALAMAKGAEDAGFESIWTVEHVVVPVGYESTYPYDRSGRMPGNDFVDIPDPLIWLAFLASATTTLKLATGILIAPQRNPLLTAKEVATLDQLSGGRAILGVGVGWLEEEFDALGVPFARRGARLDEYVQVMRTLWSEPKASFDGEFTSFGEVICQPKPVRRTVPVVIGGHTEAAARRAGRLGDGFFPGKGSNDRIRELIAVMRAAAEEAGRDPDAIEITASGAAAFGPDPLEALAELAAMGVGRVMVPPLSFDPAAIGDALAEFGENVIASMR